MQRVILRTNFSVSAMFLAFESLFPLLTSISRKIINTTRPAWLIKIARMCRNMANLLAENVWFSLNDLFILRRASIKKKLARTARLADETVNLNSVCKTVKSLSFPRTANLITVKYRKTPSTKHNAALMATPIHLMISKQDELIRRPLAFLLSWFGTSMEICHCLNPYSHQTSVFEK